MPESGRSIRAWPGGGCARCGRTVTRGRRYVVHDGQQQQVWCLGCALRHRTIFRKALGVAVVVGIILNVINQGDLFVTGRIGKAGLVKMLLCFAVPFCVSVYSVLAMKREPPGVNRDDSPD